MTDYEFGRGNGAEGIARVRSPRVWNPPDPKGMDVPHLRNAIYYWVHHPTKDTPAYVARLREELSTRDEWDGGLHRR